MKKLFALTFIAALTLTSAAHAQNFTGGFGIGGSGEYTSTGFTLSANEVYEGGNGSFALLPLLPPGIVAATNVTVTGLSGTTNHNFTIPLPTFEISSTTTTPDEYAFEMLSIKATSTGNYIGTGEFIDNTGVLAPTDATFTLGFSGNANTPGLGYSFSTFAAPEPSSWALGLIALGSVFYLRRRVLRA